MAKALSGLAIAYGVASVAVALDPIVPTTYAATSSLAVSADLAAGLGLIAAGGIVVWWERPAGSIGVLTTLLGVAWLAPDWVGWEGGPAVARSLAMIAPYFLLPLLLHLVLALPAGRVAGRVPRFGVALVYAGAAVVGVGRALFRDPFLDLDCWSNCTENVFLVHSAQELVQVLDDFWLWFSLAAWPLVAALACRRFMSATRAGRGALGPVIGPAVLAAAAQLAYTIALLNDPAEDPEGSAFHAIFLARALSFACLAGGVAWTVVRRRRTRAAIARLAADLGEAPEPGSLQAALARSLGDAELRVAYWRSGSPPYVDAEGRPVETPSEGVTPIVRNGEPVAVVIHDRALSVARELEREIGPATRMAVDNERLRAAVLAQLEDLRSSRARVVAAGDAARRRIERDLHDGAQQRLLTLSYELRLAHTAAEGDGNAELATALAATGHDVQAALAELRDLAHGIHPAILTEAGLGPALWTLADAAALPVEIDVIDAERYPAPVERAMYVALDEAVADAALREATFVGLRILRDGPVLIAEVTDDGAQRSTDALAAEDRVGALGGRLHVGPTWLRVEVPCE